MLDLIDAVAADLDVLRATAVFTGASTLPLLVTDPVVRGVLRHTRDVDVIVLVQDLEEYQTLQDGLRGLGYDDKLDEEGPMCRLWRQGVPVDIMPCPDHGVGTANRWFQPGSKAPMRVPLPSGRGIEILGPVYFAAAKVEAFRSRGRLGGALDWYGAPDLEDLLALVDGRTDLPALVAAAPSPAREHISAWARELLLLPDGRDVLAGNAASPGRAQVLHARLAQLAGLV